MILFAPDEPRWCETLQYVHARGALTQLAFAPPPSWPAPPINPVSAVTQ